MSNEIKYNILKSNYRKAEYLLKISEKHIDLRELLIGIAWDTESLASYGMIFNLLLKKNTDSSLHNIAADLLAYPLCHIEGAYSVALYHARKALEFDPTNFEYKQFLLFFFDIPEQLISNDEALNIAKEILEKEPQHIIAQDVIKRLTKS